MTRTSKAITEATLIRRGYHSCSVSAISETGVVVTNALGVGEAMAFDGSVAVGISVGVSEGSSGLGGI
jgi:hypothetical protein